MTVTPDDDFDPTANTSSGIPVPPWSGPADAKPGTYPYTRGIAEDLYRQDTWVMGLYSGYASPRETNLRIKSLLAAGQKGFSIALDLPTQSGLDSDDSKARGEVGRVGTPIDTVLDVEALLDGIDLSNVAQIRTTANAIGPLAVAWLVVLAERQGVDPNSFRVLLQNDVLKEYVARGTYIFPPAAGLRFSVDTVEYCRKQLPHWEPIEFCGYHIRDSGSNAVQEVGVALGNAIEYLDEAVRRGVSIDDLAPHTFMFLSAGLDIFEEVAKFRAARRLWSSLMRERYGVAPENCGLKIFSYTLGSPLTSAEPLNNAVRVAYEALSAVLGGAQTLATSSFDEALGLPSEEAVHLSLRTQQILAHETGVRRSTDPLGGSYHVEELTDELERRITVYVDNLHRMGGALAALESGWLSRDLSDAAYTMQLETERGVRPVVGVNVGADTTRARSEVRAFAIRAEGEGEQVARLEAARARRDEQAVATALAKLRAAAASGENTVPYVIDAVREIASVGEICGALAEVWGLEEAAAWHLS
jgi:methylmalonyl-CoA mutase N-terminal domain/subunit